MITTPAERKAKCAYCGHARESHDYSGCLLWINADASNKCSCKVFEEMPKESLGHICPACINSVFWAHRKALELVLNISNTRGEDESVIRRGMADAAFDCLSFFDLYYDGCLHYKEGALKDHEVWIDGKKPAT